MRAFERIKSKRFTIGKNHKYPITLLHGNKVPKEMFFEKSFRSLHQRKC